MNPSIVVTNVGKMFRRYHADRPSTIQEAIAKGLQHRTIERFWALRDVSFTVGAGKAVGIIGSNGSGKSTLLRLVGGVGRPETGRIDVHGRVGALLDLGAGFHPDLTGRENAVLAGILNGLTRRQVHDRLESIVAFAEVEKALDNPIRTYSSGMQMRLAFSVAVHTEPEVLLIDEVLSVGDISFQQKCLDRINAFKAAGCTILLVSHVGRTVENLCDEAVWLKDGRLMAHGATDDVVRQYIEDMGASTTLPQAAASTEGDSYPVSAQPPTALRTESGRELPADERLGSTELTIGTVRVLDREGHPVADLPTGQPVDIEIAYTASSLLVAPIFCARIVREDGVICYGFHTQASPLSMQAIQGTGRVVVHVDRVDLNPGRYLVDTACFAQDWAYAYDTRLKTCAFAVHGGDVKVAALAHTPHRWDLLDGHADTARVPAGDL